MFRCCGQQRRRRVSCLRIRSPRRISMASSAARFVGAIDQGTSSTRFILFDEAGTAVCTEQKEFDLIQPQPGCVAGVTQCCAVELTRGFARASSWIEQDPRVLLSTVLSTMKAVVEKRGLSTQQVLGVGITNQRETTVVWDRESGEPLHNAIVWSDLRTAPLVEQLRQRVGGNADHFRARCGLPLSTYFSALKLAWLRDNVPAVRDAMRQGRAAFGTVDSWLMYKLSRERVHKTDVSNASRTMLMNLASCEWDTHLCESFGVPSSMLPQICSSSEHYGTLNDNTPLPGVPITGCLGDQQAALVGQGCVEAGSAKSTYGTGTFVLFHTGPQVVHSRHGLLSTVAYQFGGRSAPVSYALEGSIAVAGLGVKWLRDNLGVLQQAADINTLAASVPDNGGVYFVPAFAGLFAPHWRADARGTILGLTQYSTRAHIARALLEAVAFQAAEVLEAMHADAGLTLHRLLVDGGVSRSQLMMQTQADLLGIPVVRPLDVEATARGAALAAGLHCGLYRFAEHVRVERAADTFQPTIAAAERERRLNRWKRAVQKSMDWADDEKKPQTTAAL